MFFERNLVHERSHEVKPAPVRDKQSLGLGWIGDCVAIKAFSLIPHGDRKLSIHAASAANVNLLVRSFVIAVNHRVGEGLKYGNFNYLFNRSRLAAVSHEEPNELHELIYERRDGGNTAGERLM